jgi:molybdopterin/thiamine biosynthesis adenylyltransferase
VRRVVLIDGDVYEEKNLASQDITRRDVGRPKAMVQARRLRRIAPFLDVVAIPDLLENVPLGLLRAAILLGCLDSRAPRRALNSIAFRLGVPWIDAGVHADQLLARVNVRLPGSDKPCLECAWDARDYETLEQTYPCAGENTAPPTNAPSGLGGLAASLQALETQKMLDGCWEGLAVGKQVTISALAHRHYVTSFSANPGCRFDHEAAWRIETLAQGPAQLTVRQAFELGRPFAGGPLRLRVAFQLFATTLRCLVCGQRRDFSPWLLGRLRADERACAGCGRAMRPAGTDTTEWLHEADVAPALLDAPLGSLGLRHGDVFTVADDAHAAHFQLGVIP